MINPEFTNQKIKQTFDDAPEKTRDGMLKLRSLIFETAANLPEIGGVQEDLKWGQPAYLTVKKAGSTLRIGTHKSAEFALFAHCQSSIISDFATTFPNMDRIDGNRAVLFDHCDEIDSDRISILIKHALTYHLK